MPNERKPFNRQRLETPQGKLDALWRDTMTLMSASGIRHLSDDRLGDFHELVCRMKRRADRKLGATGSYPDDMVSRFLYECMSQDDRLANLAQGRRVGATV